eukprot:gnl/TRDRNA2_/TRDRNA2_54117_c0_seq2.p1 gnl/TRDRNA2_/TRDRNA2_54117_c0~~gnl/TRDRNA2_/TRDRNA2_54117_c0_seq2.p1  ORF type:complete len:131 (+),score=11.42 gnl/TRDRNA2_/TRDRNA2_54117_c0_seq2:145-537(+)
MSGHLTNIKIQRCGCTALSFLANIADNQVHIAQLGGMEAIVGAMCRFTADCTVQAAGCQALANLARNSMNQIRIAQLGGIEVVVAALQSHPENHKIKRCARTALATLAETHSNRYSFSAKNFQWPTIEGI